MARSARLLRLLHALRMLPAPVTASRLAAETGVSIRTLYRDIEALRGSGAVIDGAPGYGYRLTEDSALPPQSFTRLEIEAVALGLAEIRATADPALAAAAEAAFAKITATLPERQQRQALHAVLQAYRFEPRPVPPVDLHLLRAAAWDERAVDIAYADASGAVTNRRIWPLSIVYLDRTLVLLAWCCLRRDFRRFILDRIATASPTDESFRPRRVPLLREFVGLMRRPAA